MPWFSDLFDKISAKRPRPDGKPALTVRERFSALKNIPAFLKLIWETSPSLTLGNIGLRLLRAALPVAMLYVGQLILDSVVSLARSGGNSDASLGPLLSLVALEFVLAILSDTLGRGVALLDSLLGDLFANRSSVRLMEHAAELDLDQFEDSTFYDKLERARRQTLSRTVLMAQVLSQAQDAITMAFLAIGLVAFNPWLLLLLLVAVIPAFLGESHFNERSYSLVHGWTPERRELDYLRQTGASDDTAKEVKIFGLSGFLIDRFKLLSDQFYQQNKALVLRRAGWGAFFAAVGAAGYYAAYVYIISQAVRGQISIGQLTFLAGSFARMRGLLEGILSRFSSVAEGALYLQDFFDFFRIQPRIIRDEAHVVRPFPRPIQVGFQFENVGFKYRNAGKWAIRNLSFTLQAGEKLALVGENGAGKTTLVKLLARLYDPTEGRILLDGHDLREYDPAELRQEIGVIFQDFVRFQLSAGQNLAVGRIEEKGNQDRIQAAAAQSLADTVVQKLPGGYDQIIGRRFAGGVDLSGGEWQKIALGRAYMRDAQLLILDEPTAALDARAEHEVFQRFADLTKGKTAVLISHRFSTVRMADRILVIENGEFVEIGSHPELLARGGRYAELFALQAAGYR
ncbi:ABC transporter ATP-binding protein [Hymenobacter qilianensis]|uniref:ABC transporter ATP-binding protein n=2 Tax=Hymenobacter qilianensis TaxID=1385715 RepID=A0ACB5PT98_9BACT|nr:ABC transporter ATP-binding protein [Hymenobacter qilianensis]QNP52664.1 ABC transporter ATP-binding protein [Hymenobacter qilianensis]GGF69646.1 ABC transporter ATP-binding protein [Hymenobacter qilianensis]